MTASTNQPRPEINFVNLLRKTLAKVIAHTGLEEDEASIRMVSTCLVCIAAEYTQATQDDPVHIEKLFSAFLRGSAEEQKEAIRVFGEAFAPSSEPEKPLITVE